ncbi:bifunctional UDP-N-acetylglucosamine diphosphorylase/glucosamine-1-phosphate N-acetyltransferase GlmU [Arthrospira platensis]|jgi:bifunctional UDP-N-acetylglucosamine pyrophosphorylase/glucosamine-1-phosphate N-acetyltransferase|uniref:Bifunctional protein GlmU n=1 Tax=Limnospira platensis NIES-46 TaxID=1236695 RepID=A0A5M3SYH4_LIMPL|nr:bifunctional UDP-N-acetylglucosamine diphosphorylase/glucosamine-1-phosphate N-acetyltransferase GlmU [Arthrospira platensis]AMW29407.1 bifunctional N-acetylglucosamine-1-phosphate uridyltransferase/glucosamine-1-phosphate acetyltransferase [Arthrospira platensis YZ]KDR56767.1 bifunctional N-acetylglucosamine-1-phosphate uridyltransferase/glucosamine-1-phosphate acetyltransferase [Arthrospira platensis str. Paraca]MBD2670023.1 bifunctional UDP-N-acetylglucosamine diphosphorylase/glucosamine-1
MVAVAILAAGRGTRMKSDLPKVLHELGGRSLVEWVLESARDLQPLRKLVIVGYGGDQVQTSLMAKYADAGLEFVEQKQQLGTGHAIQQVLPYLQDFTGDLLVLNGDVPLLRPQTLQRLMTIHKQEGNAATIVTANLPNPTGYGRVFCDSKNLVKEIVEHRDCTEAQKQNHRINAGIYCFNWQALAKILPHLKADNDQQEYYLTDTVHDLDQVMAVDVEDFREIMGINNRRHLAAAHEVLQEWIKEGWMDAGVTLIDPDSITIDDTVQLEPDVIIEPQTHLRGKTLIKSGSRIGPGTLIENSEIGENVRVLYSVISDSTIASNTRIGPYAHLRGHANIAEGCRIGNFVELKNAEVGPKTNIAHLSYIGDATLGEKVNIGAGTITANYDGFKKHHTTIGDRTKTGSNSVIVAPVTLGNDVTVAAGSVITNDVPDDSLAIARERQVVKHNWRSNQPQD